jgi:sugar lactone lactonase YvrE
MIEKNTQSNTEELKHRRSGGAFDMLARIFRNVISIVFSSGAVIEDRMGGGEGSFSKADSVFQIYHKNKSKKDAYNFIYIGREGRSAYKQTNYLEFAVNHDSKKIVNEDYKANGHIVFSASKDGETMPGLISIASAPVFYQANDFPGALDKEGIIFFADTRKDGLFLSAYTKIKEGADPNTKNISDMLYQYQSAVSADGAELSCYDSSNNLVTQIILNENGIKITGDKIGFGNLPISAPSEHGYLWNNIPDFSVVSQDIYPVCVTFKPDGTKMYMVGQDNATIYQYSLSTPWDMSTAYYDSVSFSVSSEDSSPNGVTFKSDGSKMYVVGDSGNSVYQYSLSTPWNLSTASYDSDFSVSSQDTRPQRVSFKSDGAKMYLLGYAGDKVYQYTLSIPWDLSTATYDTVSLSVVSQDTYPRDISFKPDGTKMYLVGYNSQSIYQYTLSTPWDLSTASYDSVFFSTTEQETSPFALAIKSDGTKMYLVGQDNTTVYQYTLSTPWNVSTAIHDSGTLKIS